MKPVSPRTSWLWILSILMGANLSLFALDPAPQPIRYRSRTWTVRDGLPQNSVNAVVQDPEGYLWIATFGGLVRFNGHQFQSFSSAQYSGLRTDRILALFVDGQGDLWVGTEQEGLAVRAGSEFRAFLPKDGSALNTTILALRQSRSGTMYVGTQNGLLQFDARTFRRWTVRDGLPDDRVQALLEDRQGVLWAGTFQGLCRRADNAFEIICDSELRLFNIQSLSEGRDGTLWVGTDHGLFQRTPEGFRRVPLRGAREGENVSALLVDTGGVLWVGLDPGGVYRIDAGKAQQYLAAEWAPDESITTFFEDAEGNLWIGTNGDGMHQLVESRIVAHGGPLSPLDMPIRTVLEDGRGGWWIGTYGHGPARLFSEGITTFPGRGTPLEHQLVVSLYWDERKTLWIGTENNGLFLLIQGQVSPGPVLPPGSRAVLSLAADLSGRLLIGTGDGLFTVDGEGGTVRPVPGSRGLSVRFIHPRPDGLWLGTDSGVHVLSSANRVTWDRTRGLSHNSVRALYTDADGAVWIGTYGGGLNRLKDGRITRYDTLGLLNDRTVSFIAEDARGMLWMTGNLGVYSVNRGALNALDEGATPVDPWVSHWTEEDGLVTRECNGGSQPAGALTPDGRLVVPTIRGIAIISISADLYKPYPPPRVRIERMQAGGKEIPLDGSIRLPPGVRNVEVEYAVLSYAAPKHIRCLYRIEGLSDAWEVDDGRYSARFGSLPPGRFRFRVIGGHADGAWNREGAVLSFVVRPYFHQTLWFWALCGAALVLLVYGILRIRTAALRARETRLEAEVKARTEAQEVAEGKYSALVRHSPIGVYQALPEGRFLMVNPALVTMLGYESPEELMRVDIARDLWTGAAARLRWQETIEREGIHLNQELILRRKDGSHLILLENARAIRDASGAILHYEGTLIDITERKKAEMALRTLNQELEKRVEERTGELQAMVERMKQELNDKAKLTRAFKDSEQYYRSLFESAHDAILIIHPEGEIVLDANRRALEMYGFSREEFIGSSLKPISKDAARGESHIQKTLQKGYFHHFETTQFHKDGTAIDLEINASLVDYKGAVAILSINRDITQRKRAGEAVRTALDEKEILLKEIQHRVKNNLQIIAILLDLQSGTLTDPADLRLFHKSRNRVKVLTMVHEKLCRSQNLSRISLPGYLQGLAEYLSSLYSLPGKAVNLVCRIEEAEVGIDDAMACGLILNELISNACKHAFQDRAASATAPLIWVEAHCAGGGLELRVADNGMGLPPSIDVRQTSTMGLRLVSLLVRQLEGTMTVERENGTIFRICFTPLKQT